MDEEAVAGGSGATQYGARQHGRSPSGGRTVLIAFIVVVATLTAASLVEWALRNGEMNALTTAIESSEAVIGRTKDGIIAAAPASQHSTAARREAMREDIARAAAVGGADLIVARDEIVDLRIMPWHRSIAEARNKYLRHHDVWARYYAEVEQEPSNVADVPSSEISGTFRLAHAALLDAIPPSGRHNLKSRIKAIFAS